jgi:nucleoside diphosphate kinase
MLERWILTCNYSFAKPTAVEAAEVGRLLDRCEKEGRIRGEMAERVRFCL